MKRKRFVFLSVLSAVFTGMIVWIGNMFKDVPVLFVFVVPLLLISFMGVTMPVSVTEIVADKETKMKIVQDIYGMPSTVYW